MESLFSFSQSTQNTGGTMAEATMRVNRPSRYQDIAGIAITILIMILVASPGLYPMIKGGLVMSAKTSGWLTTTILVASVIVGVIAMFVLAEWDARSNRFPFAAWKVILCTYLLNFIVSLTLTFAAARSPAHIVCAIVGGLYVGVVAFVMLCLWAIGSTEAEL